MAISQAQKKATENYLKKQEEIKIRVKKGHKDEIKTAAEKQGQSLNGYIVTAIDEKIERDSGKETTANGNS